MLVAMIAHPVVFVFIWGKDGLLGINPFENSVVSALILLLIESAFFSIILVLGIPIKVPKGYLLKIILFQTLIHAILGILMGFTYDTIPL